MVTKNVVRKGVLAQKIGNGNGNGVEHSSHHHQQHVQLQHENGFILQYEQPLAPPMHPLAPPPKRVKPNPYNEPGLLSPLQMSMQMQYPSPSSLASASASSAKRRGARKVAPPMPQVLPTPIKAGQVVDPSKQNPYSTSRGLRHFSMKVCEKVEEKGTTTYNEVADELVRELKQAEEVINAAAAARGELPVKKKTTKKTKTGKAKKNHDDKNIRRRVYDALNVLMAMDIITKDKKEITWRGLPGSRVNSSEGSSFDNNDNNGNGNGERGVGSSSSSPTVHKRRDGMSRRQRVQQLQEELTKRQEDIRSKRECLQELMVQNVCFQNLLGRNHAREVDEQMMQMQRTRQQHYNTNTNITNIQEGHDGQYHGEMGMSPTTMMMPAMKAEQEESHQDHVNNDNNDDDENCEVKEIKDEKIPLPFLIVNTDSKAVVQCEMCPQRTNVSFDFSQPFEINDDNEILKRLGMDRTSMEALQRSMPPDLFHYCNANGLLHSIAR